MTLLLLFRGQDTSGGGGSRRHWFFRPGRIPRKLPVEDPVETPTLEDLIRAAQPKPTKAKSPTRWAKPVPDRQLRRVFLDPVATQWDDYIKPRPVPAPMAPTTRVVPVPVRSTRPPQIPPKIRKQRRAMRTIVMALAFLNED